MDEIDVGHLYFILCISISKNKKYLLTASADCRAKVIDLSLKIVIKTFTGHTNWIRCAIFGNGDDIFTGSNDNKIKRWNISTSGSNDNTSSDNTSSDNTSSECINTYLGHNDIVTCVILDEINNRIFSSSFDTRIICWDVETGDKLGVMFGHNKYINSICFVNHNTIASASDDTTIKLWNTNNFECLKTLQTHNNWIDFIVAAPDELHIICGGQDDKTIKIWDTRSGVFIETLTYHSDCCFKLVVSSDGRYIISGDYCGKLVITRVSPQFAFVVYTNNIKDETITLLSDGILRNKSDETIYQIQSNDLIEIINDSSFKIGNCQIIFTTNTRDIWIEYLKAVQLQLVLSIHEKDKLSNIINRYRFDLLQIINHEFIPKNVFKLIGNYTF